MSGRMGGPRLTPHQVEAVRTAAGLVPSRDRQASTVHLLRDIYGASLPEIGRVMGHRDHTSAIAMLRREVIQAMPRYHIARGRALQLLERST